MNNSFFEDFKNAWQKPNNAPAQLIIINVVVFLVLAVIMVVSTVSKMDIVFQVVYQQFSIPPTFAEFITRPWTLFTYAFAHSLSGIFHILFNMLGLYWFSKLILEYLGNNRVISLYVLGALSGSILYLLMYNFIPYYQEQTVGINGGMVGASAAVYAIVVGAAVFMPNYTFFLMFLGPVKIKYIAAFFIVGSWLGLTGSNAGGNIAHLGGALMGWLFIAQLRAGSDMGAWIISVMRWFKSFFAPSPKIKVTHRKNTPKATSAKRSPLATPQEEIDAILDKISHSGYESLTKEEKEKLFNASKK